MRLTWFSSYIWIDLKTPALYKQSRKIGSTAYTFPMSNSLSPSVSQSFPPTLSHIRAFPLRATISIPIAVSASASPSTHHRRFPWIPASIMSSNTKLAATQPELCQLDDSSDFENLLSPSGYISICGFGSLLSGGYS